MYLNHICISDMNMWKTESTESLYCVFDYEHCNGASTIKRRHRIDTTQVEETRRLLQMAFVPNVNDYGLKQSIVRFQFVSPFELSSPSVYPNYTERKFTF